ncbi:hypothetical protein C0J52_11192 [Blattella germanica]|nr:hypothetical protein C0J52_11192 [Blattella germanica]
MEDSMSIRSGASEDDFGFVKRDSELLEKALTSSSSVGGTHEQQQVPESSGSDKPETEEDVTSAAAELQSIEEDDTSQQSDSNNRKLGGTVDQIPQADQLGSVYDASKRKTTVAPGSNVVRPKPAGPGILRKMSSKSLVAPKPAAEGPPASKEEDLPQSFQKKGEEIVKFHAIDTISYGVQDLVYTRVFSMIVVREMGDLKGQHPFECHAFVCESRNSARKLTYALAAAFHEYSKLVKAASSDDSGGKDSFKAIKKRFAIDLRSPEEIEAELMSPQPDDSEA